MTLVFGLIIIGALSVGIALIYDPQGPTTELPDASVEAEGGEDSPAPVAVLTGSPVRYGVAAYADDEDIHTTHDPLCAFLEMRLERPCEVVIVDDHALSDRLCEGDLSLAALSPYRYVKQKGVHAGLRVVARASNPGGDSYVGQIFVMPDSGIETLADLRDKQMCFVGRESTSGYLYPAALFRQAGIDIKPESRFFAGVHWNHSSHAATLRSLRAGDCDAAAASQNAVDEAGFASQTFHPIATTARIPYDAYVIAPGVGDADATAITDALLSLSPGSHEATEIFGEAGQLQGFTEASDEDYDEAREIIGFVDAGGD